MKKIILFLFLFISNAPFEQHLVDANTKKILLINSLLLINSFVNNCHMSIFSLLRERRLISLFVRLEIEDEKPVVVHIDYSSVWAILYSQYFHSGRFISRLSLLPSSRPRNWFKLMCLRINNDFDSYEFYALCLF